MPKQRPHTWQQLLIYVDFVVVSGQTYYYVVTAVDTTGLESEDSNQVTAVIPTP